MRPDEMFKCPLCQTSMELEEVHGEVLNVRCPIGHTNFAVHFIDDGPRARYQFLISYAFEEVPDRLFGDPPARYGFLFEESPDSVMDYLS